MYRTRLEPGLILAVVALLAAAGLAVAAPAPDDDKGLRKQALALNDVTGDDPIKGQIDKLVADPPGTKKLLAVAVAMTKEKEQPFNYNACYILGRTAQRLKDFDPAQTFYRLAAEQATALKSGYKLGQSFGGLIDLLYENKKYEESEKLCKEFLALDGDQTVARLKVLVFRRMIQALAKQEKFDDANKHLDTLLKAQPDNWLTLELKGWVQREAAQYDDAAKTYEDVLDHIKKDKELTDEEKKDFTNEIRYSLSNVYLDLKQIDKVTEQLETLMKDDPDNPTYYNDLGYIWADHDMNLPKAEELIKKALDLDRKQRKEANPNLKPDEDKDNAAYLDSMGWVLFKQKKYKEAKPFLLDAVKDKEGQHIEIFDHLGDLHLALGEKTDAVAAWKKGIEVVGDTKREKEKKVEVEKKLKDNQ